MVAELTLEPRVITGKKTAQLRRRASCPQHLRPPPSSSPFRSGADFLKTLRASTKNEVIDLRPWRKGLIRDPLNGALVHADLSVSLREKMKADMPLV
jgi:hypothetical protein